jgi:glyoxylase I family protein
MQYRAPFERLVFAVAAMSRRWENSEMERVHGIGGLFFKAKNPVELAQWYERHLGVNPVPQTYEATPWMQQAGPTVFAPFEADTDYFGPAEQAWMVNFRVANLDAMTAQLRAAGIAVELSAETSPNGRFARLQDPEGNPIELWEPADH